MRSDAICGRSTRLTPTPGPCDRGRVAEAIPVRGPVHLRVSFRPSSAAGVGCQLVWGLSSVGRALLLHSRSQGFEAPSLHKTPPAVLPTQRSSHRCPVGHGVSRNRPGSTPVHEYLAGSCERKSPGVGGNSPSNRRLNFPPTAGGFGQREEQPSGTRQGIARNRSCGRFAGNKNHAAWRINLGDQGKGGVTPAATGNRGTPCTVSPSNLPWQVGRR